MTNPRSFRFKKAIPTDGNGGFVEQLELVGPVEKRTEALYEGEYGIEFYKDSKKVSLIPWGQIVEVWY